MVAFNVSQQNHSKYEEFIKAVVDIAVVLNTGQNSIVDHRFCKTDLSSTKSRLAENIFTLSLVIFQIDKQVTK